MPFWCLSSLPQSPVLGPTGITHVVLYFEECSLPCDDDDDHGDDSASDQSQISDWESVFMQSRECGQINIGKISAIGLILEISSCALVSTEHELKK